ncbi:Tic20 family protein [Floridanema aerugineum]|jgi:uncharacterized membrane protein|uniref:Tic20 family protein n=1 Tax=Floridaenema aerugineum BLCC-F46 TaxID=3153654 RepID=A0ABV4X0E2_9CYAN
MSWRGTTTVADRIFASLPYLLPLMDGLSFSGAFFSQFPSLRILILPLLPLLQIYGIINSSFFGFGSLILFLGLYFLVVRNEKVPHFIRFNTMQAILIGIVLSLCGLILGYILAPVLGTTSFAMQTLMTTIFLGVVAAFFYSVIQTLMGRYAEIPTISEAVYMQVR